MVPRMRLSCMFCTMFPVSRSVDRGHSENSDSDSFLHFFCRGFTQINTDYFKRLKTVSRKGADVKGSVGSLCPTEGARYTEAPGYTIPMRRPGTRSLFGKDR